MYFLLIINEKYKRLHSGRNWNKKCTSKFLHANLNVNLTVALKLKRNQLEQTLIDKARESISCLLKHNQT